MTDEKVEIKVYDHTDIRDECRCHGYEFSFLADVAGENPWLSDLQDTVVDNHYIAERLQQMGAATNGVKLDPEGCCLFVYFKTKHDGVEFLKKLRAWLHQKARLLEKARAY
jgi:hypothetical protein